MKFLKLLIVATSVTLAGCNVPDSDVSRTDVEKNKKEFSQEAYEDAMRKAGKGAELDAEKKRNEAYQSGGQGGGQ